MPTIYLSYRQPNAFTRLPGLGNEEDAIGYGQRESCTIIKVADYEDGQPESGTMSILFPLNETGGTSGSSSRESSGTPPPENALDAAHLVPSANSGIVSPTEEEEEQVRRYNLNIFNVLEFSNIYTKSQQQSREYYSRILDGIIQKLNDTRLPQVIDQKSHEDLIITYNRTFEDIIYFIKMLNNIYYIGVDTDIPQIVGYLSRLYDYLEQFETSMTLFIDSRLGSSAFDKVVFQLKIAVAYYMSGGYQKAEAIFKKIHMAEVKHTSLVYVLVNYYYALTEQTTLNFIKSNALLEDALQKNKELKKKIPNMYLRCKLVQADNYLFLNDPRALEIHEELSPMKFSSIKPSDPKRLIPEEMKAYENMPTIMDNLVKSRYATVKYYMGNVKPTLNELQQIVNTFRAYLPAFHPFIIDAQFILYFIDFTSSSNSKETNKAAMIKLLQILLVMKGIMYPMIFLYYPTMYSILEVPYHIKIKTLYLNFVRIYNLQLTNGLPVLNTQEDNEELIHQITTVKDQIPEHFMDMPITELTEEQEQAIHYLNNLPYLFITDLCKQSLLSSDPAARNRNAMYIIAFNYFNKVPEQRESFKIAVRTSINTADLEGNDIPLFEGGLYEAAAKSLATVTNDATKAVDMASPTIDRELLIMARDEFLKIDTIGSANVMNLYRDGAFDGTSIDVTLVTKAEGVLRNKVPDYVSIKITKDNKKYYYRLKVGSKFKLPKYKDILTVTNIIVDNESNLIGIQYSVGNTGTTSQIRVPSIFTDANQKQSSEKRWISLTRGLDQESAPKRGGTRSKKSTPLEKKTRKVRNNLSVKMGE